MNKLENLKKKIIYRASYRGTKEMDLLLTSFVGKYIDILDEEYLFELENLLNLEDEIIYDYFYKGISNEKIIKNKINTLLKDFKIL